MILRFREWVALRIIDALRCFNPNQSIEALRKRELLYEKIWKAIAR